MIRFLRTLVVVLLLAVVVGAGLVLVASHDAVYTLKEWLAWSSYHRYDGLISEIASKNKLDPMLLKSVIWRESTFDPNTKGKEGERGLMQVSEAVVADWAGAQKTQPPSPDDLFDPRTNIEIGAWNLKRALDNYSSKDDPVPFALAQYNAGRQRASQWLGENSAAPVNAKQFKDNITIGSTRKYVDTIEARYLFYKQRGRM
ncbi:MAG TPA: lytic transglycosylase domain-containing protein [Chthoniobacteraceae bacterium]|nr:lytic transglycosylase domain-containing protein [Chthoniobacteraceae bacterium]